MNGLQYIDVWAHKRRRERLLRDRRAQPPAIMDVECTIILPTALTQGEIRPGQRGTAIARQPLPGGTIHRRGTTQVLLNGPGMTILGGPGTGEITAGIPHGMTPLVRMTMIGAVSRGGGRHPVPAQEGPRGARCLSRTLKEN